MACADRYFRLLGERTVRLRGRRDSRWRGGHGRGARGDLCRAGCDQQASEQHGRQRANAHRYDVDDPQRSSFARMKAYRTARTDTNIARKRKGAQTRSRRSDLRTSWRRPVRESGSGHRGRRRSRRPRVVVGGGAGESRGYSAGGRRLGGGVLGTGGLTPGCWLLRRECRRTSHSRIFGYSTAAQTPGKRGYSLP